ncbi:hypothetical protein STAS_27293 [Striga asiatica]|uniref:Uncharacterized protein n=1 Tax=Striga asiatica TaxID=4170 RepID=A0A5A7QYC8_STRAF|nr:hypothetical protein STAS_27293 [Striga asiatica]
MENYILKLNSQTNRGKGIREKRMVAISLYKGNFHKASDVPRRWPPPTPKLSLKDFKILLHRRDMALARLRSSSAEADINVATTSGPSTGRSPSPEPNRANTDSIHVDIAVNKIDGENHAGNNCSEPELLPKVNLKEEVMIDETEDSLKKLMEESDAMVEEQKNEENVKDDGKSEAIVKPEGEKSNSENGISDAEKRTKEVKEKLEILNEKKHSLVKVLKQILNAEEQLKRQNCTQGISGLPPSQVDTTSTDSGSMIKVNTPKIGPDGIPCGNVEGGEPDDVSNHNATSRHLPRTSSTSPSSGSQQRKPNSTMAPLSYRATTGVASSPSRFAPTGQGQGQGQSQSQGQGQGQVQSALSVSATSYVVSSPSPAASGGTSIFRDARLPSPWN